MHEVRTVVLVYYGNEISTKKKNKTKQNKGVTYGKRQEVADFETCKRQFIRCQQNVEYVFSHSFVNARFLLSSKFIS